MRYQPIVHKIFMIHDEGLSIWIYAVSCQRTVYDKTIALFQQYSQSSVVFFVTSLWPRVALLVDVITL